VLEFFRLWRCRSFIHTREILVLAFQVLKVLFKVRNAVLQRVHVICALVRTRWRVLDLVLVWVWTHILGLLLCLLGAEATLRHQEVIPLYFAWVKFLKWTSLLNGLVCLAALVLGSWSTCDHVPLNWARLGFLGRLWLNFLIIVFFDDPAWWSCERRLGRRYSVQVFALAGNRQLFWTDSLTE
jgi:hypothetical protein